MLYLGLRNKIHYQGVLTNHDGDGDGDGDGDESVSKQKVNEKNNGSARAF